MAKRRRGTAFRQTKVRFGDVRRQKRALTTGVRYHVRYRDRATGRWTSFIPDKSLNPVLFVTATRFTTDRQKKVTVTRQVPDPTAPEKPLTLPARKAKRPLTGAAIGRIVDTRILKRKVAKRNLKTDVTSAFVVYGKEAVKAKPAPKKKRKKRRKLKKKKGGGPARGRMRVKK